LGHRGGVREVGRRRRLIGNAAGDQQLERIRGLVGKAGDGVFEQHGQGVEAPGRR